jgi:hypothetical protein
MNMEVSSSRRVPPKAFRDGGQPQSLDMQNTLGLTTSKGGRCLCHCDTEECDCKRKKGINEIRPPFREPRPDKGSAMPGSLTTRCKTLLQRRESLHRGLPVGVFRLNGFMKERFI